MAQVSSGPDPANLCTAWRSLIIALIDHRAHCLKAAQSVTRQALSDERSPTGALARNGGRFSLAFRSRCSGENAPSKESRVERRFMDFC